jgi:hypothetical protein
VSPNRGFEVPLAGEDLARWARWRLQRDSRRATPGSASRSDDDQRPVTDAALMKAVDYIEQSTGKAP